MSAPPGIVWNQQVSDFIDRLVDIDIAYLDAQLAIEKLIHGGLHDQITVAFELERRTIHWHWMPPIAAGLSPLDIFTTINQDGAINVILIRFSNKRQ